MAAKYILAFLALGYLVAAAWRVVRDDGQLQAPARTWAIIGAIFFAISLILFARE